MAKYESVLTETSLILQVAFNAAQVVAHCQGKTESMSRYWKWWYGGTVRATSVDSAINIGTKNRSRYRPPCKLEDVLIG